MDKQKGISTTLSVLLIILLAVVIGGVVVYKYIFSPIEEPSDNGQPEESQNEMADWDTYRNEEFGFEIEYLNDWQANVLSEGGRVTPTLGLVFRKEDKEQGLYDYLGGEKVYPFYSIALRVFKDIGSKYSSVEDFAIKKCFAEYKIMNYESVDGLKAVRCLVEGAPGGGYSVHFVKDNDEWEIAYGWLFPDKRDKYLSVFDQMLSTFEFYIKTGKFEIDYDKINELQQSVDNGHQSWRLDPEMVLRSESLNYGLTNEDLKTIKQISSSNSLGVYRYEITHKTETYVVTVIQPTPGQFQIWTIQEIELKE